PADRQGRGAVRRGRRGFLRLETIRVPQHPPSHLSPRRVITMPRKKPLDVETLWRVERVGLRPLSPDGGAAVCSVTTYSMEENKSRTSLWLLPTDSTSPRKLTSAGEKDGNPAWPPKGERIAFLARREQDGKKDKEAQLYVIAAAGGEAER